MEQVVAEVAESVIWSPRSPILPGCQVCTLDLDRLRILTLLVWPAGDRAAWRKCEVHNAWLLRR